MLSEGGMRWQETAANAKAARRKGKDFTGSIGNHEAHLAAVFGRTGVEETADGMDGLTALANDAGQIGLPSLHGVNIFALHRGMGEEDFVGMAGEAAQDEVKEFLHERRGQAALAAAARAFFTMLRTVSDICAPFFTQWSMRSTLTL